MDYNRLSHEALAFLEYAKSETPEMLFTTVINPAEGKIGVFAQDANTAKQSSQYYTFYEFLLTSFEEIHKTLMSKF